MNEVKKHVPTKYILCRTLRRKNGRRRMVGRFYTLDECYQKAGTVPGTGNYKFEIYDYKWELVVPDFNPLEYFRKEV